MSLSDNTESNVLTHLLRTSSWTKPAAIYVALFTTAPADDGTGGTEVTGVGYARIQHGPSDATWTAPSAAGSSSNIGNIVFGSPGAGGWGTVTHVGLYDAVTGGNLLAVGALTSSLLISDGDPAPAFLDGELTVTIT